MDASESIECISQQTKLLVERLISMSVERFPWLNDAIRSHQKIAFPSSTIIEGRQA